MIDVLLLGLERSTTTGTAAPSTAPAAAAAAAAPTAAPATSSSSTTPLARVLASAGLEEELLPKFEAEELTLPLLLSMSADERQDAYDELEMRSDDIAALERALAAV